MEKTARKPTNEAMTVNIALVKISTRDTALFKISSKDKKKEVKQNEHFHDQEMSKHTLKELEEKTYPFPDSDVAAMLEYLLDKEVIELPECKRPEEMNRVNDPKYCKYHRIISHLVGKCFVLKQLIMKLAQEGRIELDPEETATVNAISIMFGSLNHVPFCASLVKQIMKWFIQKKQAQQTNQVTLVTWTSLTTLQPTMMKGGRW
ncbi:hypothetical protein PS2_042855 [Malus domestica]